MLTHHALTASPRLQPSTAAEPTFGKQITMIVLLVMLAHLLIALAAYFVPDEKSPIQPNVIDVTLDMSNSPSANPMPTPPMPKPSITPPAAPPTVSEAAPLPINKTETPAATPNIAQPSKVPANDEPAAPIIQPLFKLSRMPAFSHKNEAVYPVAERRAGTQASVIAEVTIDAQGNVLAVKIIKSGGANFDEAVKTALQQSQFSPGLMDGKPVGTRFQVPYRFNLN